MLWPPHASSERLAAKTHYGTSLANVDWLHGGAESLLTITNLFIGEHLGTGCYGMLHPWHSDCPLFNDMCLLLHWGAPRERSARSSGSASGVRLCSAGTVAYVRAGADAAGRCAGAVKSGGHGICLTHAHSPPPPTPFCSTGPAPGHSGGGGEAAGAAAGGRQQRGGGASGCICTKAGVKFWQCSRAWLYSSSTLCSTVARCCAVLLSCTAAGAWVSNHRRS